MILKEKLCWLTVAAKEFVEELQLIHLNKFSALVRLLCSGKRCFPLQRGKIGTQI
jgi:hypothetical protein